MSTKQNDGGPAFPHPGTPNGGDFYVYPEVGMTLRDYFAAQAMIGLLGAAHWLPKNEDRGARWIDYSASAYSVADAMLVERAKAESAS